MDKMIAEIQAWLGAGSVNIFGMPYSGKDTVGIRLAELLNGKFLSSGMIIRDYEKANRHDYDDMNKGFLVPQDTFKSIVLPYFAHDDLKGFPLVLSSIGRWHGEEPDTMQAAENGGHPIMVAVLLDVPLEEIEQRWETSKILEDRGERKDDQDKLVLKTRIEEFQEKTSPVVDYYDKAGLLIKIDATGSREVVMENLLRKLHEFSLHR